MPEPVRNTLSAAGHVMAQLAACRCSVGLSLAWEPAVYELRGSRAELAELGVILGVADPSSPSPIETLWGWWCSASPHRALVVAEPARRTELDDLLDRGAPTHRDVTIENLADDRAALVLAGPGATRLVRSAVARLAGPVLATSRGDDYWLLILDRTRAVEVRDALLEVGRADGAVAVEAQTTDLYRSAHRVLAGQRPEISRHSPIDVTTTGVLHP
jgi:hypothetical protein